jgi:cytochrome c oxidase subunit I+III
VAAALACAGPCILRRGGVAASALLIVAAAASLAGAWALDFTGWTAVGLDAEASARGAMTAFFLSWQGFFASIGVLMGFYVLARWLKGLLAPERPSTADLVAMFLTYAAIQGAGSAVLAASG